MSQSELTPSPAFVGAQPVFGELLDQTITRVSIEPWSVRLLFETGELHIEGIWRLVSPAGATVDQSQDLCARERFELWRLAGRAVEGFQFCDDPLPRFTMRAKDQWDLEVVADEDGLEDWGLTASGGAWVICNGRTITVFPAAPRGAGRGG